MNMWTKIKPLFAEILSSKKALALIAAAIVWALAQAKVVASPDAILPLLGVLASYIVGQGVADIGKEKAKIDATTVKDLKATRGAKAANPK